MPARRLVTLSLLVTLACAAIPAATSADPGALHIVATGDAIHPSGKIAALPSGGVVFGSVDVELANTQHQILTEVDVSGAVSPWAHDGNSLAGTDADGRAYFFDLRDDSWGGTGIDPEGNAFPVINEQPVLLDPAGYVVTNANCPDDPQGTQGSCYHWWAEDHLLARSVQSNSLSWFGMGSDGTIYERVPSSDFRHDFTVRALAPDGSNRTVASFRTTYPTDLAFAAAFDASGHIYLVDSSCVVHRITISSGLVDEFYTVPDATCHAIGASDAGLWLGGDGWIGYLDIGVPVVDGPHPAYRPGPTPDLIVTSVSHRSVPFESPAGDIDMWPLQQTAIDIEVRNIGSMGSTPTSMEKWSERPTSASRPEWIVDVPAIPAGGSATITLMANSPLFDSSENYYLRVNGDHDAFEGHYANNDHEETEHVDSPLGPFPQL